MSAYSEGMTGAQFLAPENDDLWRVYRTFMITAVLGLIGAILYSASASDRWTLAVSVLGGAVLVSCAFAFLGGLIGFVFAIPRSRQDQVAPQSGGGADGGQKRLSDYAANTNLEQISDWLTKILVGISLIQFNAMAARFSDAADALAPMLGGGSGARPVTLSLMAYFMAWGFFFAYLSTRLWLPKALSRAERDEQIQKREVEKAGELRAVEALAYDALYQPAPLGYTQAIEQIQQYRNRPGAIPSPRLSLYLAAAYGQKHALEKDQDPQAADDARAKAVAAAGEALRLDPGLAPTVQQLYEGRDPLENDLVSLKPDARLDSLLESAKRVA